MAMFRKKRFRRGWGEEVGGEVRGEEGEGGGDNSSSGVLMSGVEREIDEEWEVDDGEVDDGEVDDGEVDDGEVDDEISCDVGSSELFEGSLEASFGYL